MQVVNSLSKTGSKTAFSFGRLTKIAKSAIRDNRSESTSTRQYSINVFADGQLGKHTVGMNKCLCRAFNTTARADTCTSRVIGRGRTGIAKRDSHSSGMTSYSCGEGICARAHRAYCTTLHPTRSHRRSLFASKYFDLSQDVTVRGICSNRILVRGAERSTSACESGIGVLQLYKKGIASSANNYRQFFDKGRNDANIDTATGTPKFYHPIAWSRYMLQEGPKTLKRYGVVAATTYCVVYVGVFSAFYICTIKGIDVAKIFNVVGLGRFGDQFEDGASAFLLAYAATTLTGPVRMAFCVAVTPPIHRATWPYLKPYVHSLSRFWFGPAVMPSHFRPKAWGVNINQREGNIMYTGLRSKNGSASIKQNEDVGIREMADGESKQCKRSSVRIQNMKFGMRDRLRTHK